jgi:tetratricopeptide (TPR) repeat protein
MNGKLLLIFFTYTQLFAQATQNISPFEKAMELYKVKSYNESIVILEDLNEKGTASAEELLLLSRNYYAIKDIDSSIDSLFSALKLKSNEPGMYIELVKAYSSAQRYKGAMEVCEKGVGKFPNSLELQLQKALLLPKFGKLSQSFQIIEKLKQDFPNDPRPLSVESNLYLLKADFDKAELSMKWALSLEPNHPNYKNNLAIIYEKKGDYFLNLKKIDLAKESWLLAKKELEEVNSPNVTLKNNLDRISKKLE